MTSLPYNRYPTHPTCTRQIRHWRDMWPARGHAYMRISNPFYYERSRTFAHTRFADSAAEGGSGTAHNDDNNDEEEDDVENEDDKQNDGGDNAGDGESSPIRPIYRSAPAPELDYNKLVTHLLDAITQRERVDAITPSMSRLLTVLPKLEPYSGKSASVTFAAWVMQFSASLEVRALGALTPDREK